MSDTEKCEPICLCGRSAKLRISRTTKNLYRLFYNCAKVIDDQCGFFCWYDDWYSSDDKANEEVKLIRDECLRLRQKLDDVEQEHDNDRVAWESEKCSLETQLSTIQGELDDIKKKIKLVNESDVMPPCDKLLEEDEEQDSVVIHTV